VHVYFRGLLMTPADLGNFTYGYIGAALGLTVDILIYGSVFAAITGRSLYNMDNVIGEFNDWFFIRKGFYSFNRGRYDCD